MSLKIGIVGLPNVGKSTLFNALTKTRSAQAANYPFCTIDPNVGIVEVPDTRIRSLVEIDKPAKVIPAVVEFVDIAGLVKGASKGEGLGNAFLSHIREVNTICHVVRAFRGGDVIHVDGAVEPLRDRETIETELALADLAVLQKRMEKLEGKARTGDKHAATELSALQKIESALQLGRPARSVELSPEEQAFAKDFSLLTQKPMIYAVNVSEDQVTTYTTQQAQRELGLPEDAEVVVICAKVEEDLQELSEDEAKEYLRELSLNASGLDRLIHAAYRALGYITFFTTGADEVRAWTLTRGSSAPQAAGVIHTDFEKGFIRAETIAFDDYVQFRGDLGAKGAGKMRAEGKEYIVKDGDIFHFRFNV